MAVAPYNWVSRAAEFGNSLTPTWKSAPADRAWELAAASQQHELALKVNTWKRINRRGNKALAEAVGVNPETIARYLRGEATMPLAIFNHLAHLVGLEVTVTLD